MNPDASVTSWLSMVRMGNSDGAQRLWERYYCKLVSLAKVRLAGHAFGTANEEDVALSAFASFCQRAADGHFPQVADRDDLWRLLVVITVRKAQQLIRTETRQKRQGSLQREELNIDQIIGAEPSPEFAAQCADECRSLLKRLGDRELMEIALLKMKGYTNDEICTRLDCAPRTVERRLQLIRRIWESEDDTSSGFE